MSWLIQVCEGQILPPIDFFFHLCCSIYAGGGTSCYFDGFAIWDFFPWLVSIFLNWRKVPSCQLTGVRNIKMTLTETLKDWQQSLHDLWTWPLQRKKTRITPFWSMPWAFLKKKNCRTNNCCRCSIKALTANGAGLANTQRVNKSPRGGHAVVLGHKVFTGEKYNNGGFHYFGRSWDVWSGRWDTYLSMMFGRSPCQFEPTSLQLRWGDGRSPVCLSCGEPEMSTPAR